MKISLLFGFLLAVLISLPDGKAVTPTFSVLATLGSSPNGYTPNTAIQGSDGNIYGTTSKGGSSDNGTIYKLSTTGLLTTLYTFTGGNDGSAPMGPLAVGTDGNFYGTATEGGSTGDGTFFRITPTGSFTLLHTFNGTTEGGAPTFVVADNDGNFYGTSPFTSSNGAFLQISSAGSVSVLHSFAASADGQFPNANIVEGSDGAFYGSTPEGGSSGLGTLFRIDTTGSFSVISNITNSSDLPLLTTLGDDGNIYGIIPFNTTQNHGSIFKMTNSGTRTTVYTFTGQNDGGDPAAFVQGSDGNFYGTTQNGGTHGLGTFFQISSTGTFQTVSAFSSTIDGGAEGEGLVEGTDGNYYVTAAVGGPAFAGSILQLTTAGASTSIFNFTQPGNNPVAGLLQASDGNLYGTAESGGTTGDGTIFQVTTSGSLTEFASFNFATSGSRPMSPLIQDPNTGTLYGTCFTGGDNYSPVTNRGGTIYECLETSGTNAVPASKSASSPGGFHFTTPEELHPTGVDDTGFAGFVGAVSKLGLIDIGKPTMTQGIKAEVHSATDSGTNFAAVFATGGDNLEGGFVSFSEAGTGLATYSFGDQTTDGSGPETALVGDGSGNFYGTTAFGGTSQVGTIYKITATTGTGSSTPIRLHSFATATGASPGSNNLVLGTDGNIYGTTSAGGANGGGVVFQMTPSGSYKVLHSFASPTSPSSTNGSVPGAGLVEGTDHNFYGTTEVGGTDNVGTVYSISSTGAFALLHSFNGHDGFQPQAALIEASDGNLYGITASDSFNGGVIFKIDAGLPPPTSGSTSQTITFPAIANQSVGAPPITLGATASSGLAVTYSVSGPATVSGSTLTTTGVGTVKVTASQTGNSTFAAATPVTETFTVAKGTQTITFPAVANQTFGEPAFTLPNPPTASSGLAVTLKVLSGLAKLSGNKITITGVGAVTLAASQAGNANFAAAPQVTSSFLVDKASQTIAAFAPIATQNKGEAPFAVTPPKGSSGLAVTITVQSGPATISGNKVSVTGVGTVVLAADQTGNADFNAAPEITTSFSVAAEKQTISAFSTIPAKTFGVAPFTIVPPRASSGLAVTVTVSSGNATISGNTVTLTGDGPVTLAANQAGDADFAPATQVTTTFTVNGDPQTIAPFAKIATQTFGEAPFAVTPPVASSGLAVTVTVKSGPATILNNTITLTGAGTVVLAADQPGDSTHAAAKEVTTSFGVAKSAQTVAPFTAIAGQSFGEAPFTITPPTASSNLPVVVTVKSGPAKITGDNVTLTGIGTVVLSAAQPGNADFTAAVPITTSFIVVKGTQTLAAFATIPDQAFGEPAFAVTPPVATSGLPVTVTVLSGPAKISRGKVTVTGLGTVTLAANQPGNVNVTAAPQVTTTFDVVAADQTIAAFKTIPPKVFGVAPFAVTPPVATSKLPVTLSVVSGPATISGTKVTITGTGTVVLAADQPGNADFNAAPEVTTGFTVNKAAQTIKSFAKIAAKTTTSTPFTVATPVASSGLAVTVTVQSGPATISNGTVTLSGTTGTVVLAANQAGNADFNAAPPVTVSFAVK